MYKTLLFFLLPLSCCQLHGQKLLHPGGMHTLGQLDAVKSKIDKKEQPYTDAFNQLLGYADSAALHPVHHFAWTFPTLMKPALP